MSTAASLAPIGGLHEYRMRGEPPHPPREESGDLSPHPPSPEGGLRRTRAGRGEEEPYTGKPFAFANSFNDTCGRAPMCWITSAAASAPSRPAFS